MEVCLFTAVVFFGVLSHPQHHSLALLGAGLLAGKALTLGLAPLGWRLLRRTMLGYGVALAAAASAALLFRAGY